MALRLVIGCGGASSSAVTVSVLLAGAWSSSFALATDVMAMSPDAAEATCTAIMADAVSPAARVPNRHVTVRPECVHAAVEVAATKLTPRSSVVTTVVFVDVAGPELLSV